MSEIPNKLEEIITAYEESFTEKVYSDENNDSDILMNVFGLTPELKRENRQYWGRELGMCWQRLVCSIFQTSRDDYGDALRFDADEPCDLVVGEYAIDTKYRIGSGDSGTLKKFKTYGVKLREEGYKPLFLIVRDDNLPAAITACNKGTWQVKTADESFDFIKQESGFDIKDYLIQKANQHRVIR